MDRLRIGNHRAQLSIRQGSVIVTKQGGNRSASALLVRMNDIDNHYEHAKQAGARIISPPADYPYGERQYTAEDPDGHRWTFSQTIADIDPITWGGTLFEDMS